MRKANLKTWFEISVIRPAILFAIILFLLLPAQSAFAGSILGWGEQVVGGDLSSGFVKVAAGAYHSLGLKQDGSIIAWGDNDYGQCNIPSPNSGFIAISAGAYYSLGLKQDGSIVAWGGNDYGQCNSPSPNSGFIAISAGRYHSLGLKQDGSIVAWGYNKYGQCNIPSPNSGFIDIAAGGVHSLGLKQDGSIVAWGSNYYGQCNIPSPNTGFIAIAAGSWHSLGLKNDGSIVAWGDNYYGQCNIPSPNSGFIAISAGYLHSLGLKQDGSIVAWGGNSYGQCNIPSPDSGFIAIAAGGGEYGGHSLGLKQDGSIVAWGGNDYGQCNIPSPNSGFIAISAGRYHSLGLKQDGSIVAWGNNYYGQCNIPSPNSGFIAIAAAYEHSLGLKQDGSIVAWGENDYGQCNIPSPNSGFIAIAAGYWHSLGLKQDGSIVAWGNNNFGQCNIPSPNSGFIDIAAGGVHSLGLKQDGSIVAWGAGGSGQSGRPHYGQSIVPSPNSGFIAISAGEEYSLGLKQHGSIVAWGYNGYGQCNIPSPNTGFIAISAGGAHSLGLKQDGSIVAWGYNGDGQCNIPSPNSGFIAIAAGWYHSLALKAEGDELRLKCFEINQCFQEVNEIDGYTQKYDLIETKPFAVRVNLERYPAGTRTANVKLSIVNSKTGEPIGNPPIKEEKDRIIKYGYSEPVDFIFKDNETQDMKAGDYKFSLTVEDVNGTKLLDWSHIYTFKSSKTVRMLVVPWLSYNLKSATWKDDYIKFVEKVYPVPNTNAIDANRIEIVPTLPLISGIHYTTLVLEMHDLLGLYNIRFPLSPASFICAIAPPGTLPQLKRGIHLGGAVIVEEDYRSATTLGHEIGHVYGLGEEYIIAETKNGDGLWILDQRFEFGRNPPPVKLSPTGPFIIADGWTHAGERCDWDDDADSYKKIGDDVIGWLASRYIGPGGYENENGPVNPKEFTMMSGGSWISAPEYDWLLKKLVKDTTTTSSSPMDTNVATLAQAQNRMVVSGLVNIPQKTAELRPLIPAQNLELTPEPAEPNCQLIYLSKTMLQLGTLRFLPLEGEGNILEGPFYLVVNLPVDTSLVQVVIDGTIAAELRLTDNSPTVQVLSPNGGEQVGGQLDIGWSASDMDGDKLKYIIEFSNNDGANWSPIAIDQNTTELVIDSNYLPGGNNCLVKVIASDGWNRSEDTSDAPFSITTKPPKVTILEPADGSILLYSTNMQGRCTIYDPETGYITDPNSIVWSSDIDGFLGKGNLTGFSLSLGNHILSVTATDPEGKNAADTVKVTVVANRSDFNRDLRVNFFDWAVFANRWRETCSEPNWCEGTDLNHNGLVEFGDLAIFAENWLWEKIPADFDIDDDVDFADLLMLTNHWLGSDPTVDIAPLPTGDGIVNFLDFALFAQHWLEGTQ